jgi:pyrroloquinoline quinone (PQQ) biosynthesis protein C
MSFYQQLCRDTVRQREALLAVPLLCNTLQGQITPAEYVAFLTQAYHHVRHTVPLLMACGSRMPERLAWLRQAIAHYIDEEIGHEQWILNDVAACGADPDAVQADGGSFETRLMVAYAYHGIDRGNPVGFLGMVHVLEGTSTAVASAAADAIQAALALPDAAFSYLRSHGSLDVEHGASSRRCSTGCTTRATRRLSWGSPATSINSTPACLRPSRGTREFRRQHDDGLLRSGDRRKRRSRLGVRPRARTACERLDPGRTATVCAGGAARRAHARPSATAAVRSGR